MGRDDSSAVVAQLSAASELAVASVQLSVPNDAPTPGMLSADKTVACASGGSVGIAGDLSGNFDTSATGSYSLDLMTTFTDCGLGNGLVINGAPYLTTTGTLSFQTAALTVGTVSYSGAFTANGDTCNIDVTLRLAGAPHPAINATGTVCGNAIKLGQ